MKIFIDSAKLDEIKDAYSTGIIDGVTTNPSLIKKALESMKGMPMQKYITEILSVAHGTPVSMEVTETIYEKMVKQAESIFKMFNHAGNVYIKIPISTSSEKSNFDGLKAIETLSRQGIPINCTLIFTPEQALLAAKAGAKIVSPFAGRVDDFIREKNNISFNKEDYFPSYGWNEKGRILEDNGIISGVDLVKQCVEILKKYDLKTEVLAASLRNTRQVRECALVGADIATLPYSVIKHLLDHDKTCEGIKKFTEDIVPEYLKMLK